MPTYPLYQYVKQPTDGKWAYRKAALHPNGKPKQNVVVMPDRSELKCAEGRYCILVRGKWEFLGEGAITAQHKRLIRVRQIEIAKLGRKLDAGDEMLAEVEEVGANPTAKSEALKAAIDEFLGEIQSAVEAKSKRPNSYRLMECTLRKFLLLFPKLVRVDQITAKHLDDYAAFIIKESPTHSVQSARNEYIRMLQFLKGRGVVVMKMGVPVGIKNAPKVTKDLSIIVNTEDEIQQFMAKCKPGREHVMFFTFMRSGLRLMELATTRWIDVVLDGPNPHLVVCDRDVPVGKGDTMFEFRVKWYQARNVTIDSELVALLRAWKETTKGLSEALVFGRRGKLDRHIHRTTKSIAKRAKLDEDRFEPHGFRRYFATKCLRGGMDLDTLRAQLGHRDTESLRHYIQAVQGNERATVVNAVWGTSKAMGAAA
jgi:integrase